jgi:hypothetical protein
MLDSLGLYLMQHYQFLCQQFFVKKQFFEEELIKTKEISINAES